ncbi:uncharacterized protein LACBIDRAFT_324227 [Laccaria bicolor S238N-H82]|uniref:Predicted protein n=1 Tax=Laccaria bicolor (strain S238N-H82 / ATCC MYA-4686) TaxID=486041 RepID=B0D151_LACBS|nr:uncharacterized protein LACBIDRAFT_324227 [Laccaria bicolor S238N-H82]EDR11939.1 predicted protein [Laccaria bicolor S238N-H82]|eukprot:XP_001877836.1 predicted protein [Laccaria bicolor S238N-H82]
MRFSLGALPLGLVFNIFLGTLASPLLEQRDVGITQVTWGDLGRYSKYSSASYQLFCPKPLGNTLISQFSKKGTQGFIARDDTRQEIVIVFTGSLEPIDVFTDIHIIMSPLKSQGLTNVGDAYVHTGFLHAYNVVAADVLATVKKQLASYPTYRVVATGHSLGGSVASVAALTVRAAHPNVPLELYTYGQLLLLQYGQPRTGNQAFATLVEKTIGVDHIFRGVHTFDGIPTILFKALGYRHFGTEYWNFREPGTKDNVKICNGGEDSTCSDSIPSTFINVAHVGPYFGQLMALNPLLCLKA